MSEHGDRSKGHGQRPLVSTVEKYLGWQRSIDRYGLAGLPTTRIQQYRQ